MQKKPKPPVFSPMFSIAMGALLLSSMPTVVRAADEGKSGMRPGSVPESPRKQQQAAKMDMAPHSLMIETTLMSALDQLKGLKAEVKVNEDRTPSSTFIQHYKMLGHEINEDLKKVKTHEGELQGSVRKHPNVADSSEYKSVVPSLNDLHSLNSTWQSKVADNEYWKNSKAVMSDIDRLENQINTALDKTKSFNSSQLDVSNVG